MVQQYYDQGRDDGGGGLALLGLFGVGAALCLLGRHAAAQAGTPTGPNLPGLVTGPGGVPVPMPPVPGPGGAEGSGGGVIIVPGPGMGPGGVPIPFPIPPGSGLPTPGGSGPPPPRGILTVSPTVAGPGQQVTARLSGITGDPDRAEIWATGVSSIGVIPPASAYGILGSSNGQPFQVALDSSAYAGAAAIYVFALLFRDGRAAATGMPGCPAADGNLFGLVALRGPAGAAPTPPTGPGVTGNTGSSTPARPPTPMPPTPAPAPQTQDLGWPNVIIQGTRYQFSSYDTVNRAITFRQLGGSATLHYGRGTLPPALVSTYVGYFG